jgi:mRNA interferase MazF
VVSPDDLNAALSRVIIAPLTSAGQPMGCRPEVIFQNKAARILLDQVRCVDKVRLGKKMDQIDEQAWHGVLLEMPA